MSELNLMLYRDTVPFEDSMRNILCDPQFYQAYTTGQYTLSDKKGFYTSYNNYKYSDAEKYLIQYVNWYIGNAINKYMKLANLRNSTQYTYNMWWQVYNNLTEGFDDHSHFDREGTVLSYVHFVNTDNDNPCFHFVKEDNSNMYINEKQEDFIIFNSWTRHRVDAPKSTKTRAVIAGNIRFVNHVGSHIYFKD